MRFKLFINQLAIEYLRNLYCSQAKQIRDLDELEQQEKATLPTGNRRTKRQITGKQQENHKSAFGSDALDW